MTDDLARRMHDQGLRPSGWSNQPGERYAIHHHPYDKVIAVERGSIRFGLAAPAQATDLAAPAQAIELAAGDRLDLPAGMSHDALVGPDGVACLEAHLPAGSLDGVAARRAGTW